MPLSALMVSFLEKPYGVTVGVDSLENAAPSLFPDYKFPDRHFPDSLFLNVQKTKDVAPKMHLDLSFHIEGEPDWPFITGPKWEL